MMSSKMLPRCLNNGRGMGKAEGLDDRVRLRLGDQLSISSWCLTSFLSVDWGGVVLGGGGGVVRLGLWVDSGALVLDVSDVAVVVVGGVGHGLDTAVRKVDLEW